MAGLNTTLRQLKVFLAVAEERSFSRAGEVIGLSQPAVSRAINELEQQLDVRLFDRSTREVVLTQGGEILAQRLPRQIDELENTLLEVHRWANTRRGKVRVASAPTISAALMPSCLARSAVQEPGLEILLLDRLQRDVLGSVLAGEVDFGVIVEPDIPYQSEIHVEAIMRDPFVAVLPQSGGDVRWPFITAKKADPPLWKNVALLPWKALEGGDLILLDHASGSRRLIDDALAHHAVSHRVTQQVGHASTAFELVRAGLGISVMPGLAIPEAGLPGLGIYPLWPITERSIMLAHRKNRQPSPLAQCLWRLIRDCATQIESRRQALWREAAWR